MLGEGSFARVLYAKMKKTGKEYAIKVMDKAHIKKENKVRIDSTKFNLNGVTLSIPFCKYLQSLY